MILFFLSIILIVLSLAATLLVDVTIVRYLAAFTCLSGVYLMYLYWRNLFVKIRENGRLNSDSLQLQIVDLQEQLKVLSDDNKVLETRVAKLNHIPDMPNALSLNERIDILSNYFSDDITEDKKNDYNRLFLELKDSAVSKATVEAIGEHTTKPMIEEIKSTNLPLDEDTRKHMESKLLFLAMTAIDCTIGFKSGLNDDGSLATKVASGELSEEQAIQQAKQANDNVYETPKDIRVLQQLAKEYSSDCIIVNDYKL